MIGTAIISSDICTPLSGCLDVFRLTGARDYEVFLNWIDYDNKAMIRPIGKL